MGELQKNQDASADGRTKLKETHAQSCEGKEVKLKTETRRAGRSAGNVALERKDFRGVVNGKRPQKNLEGREKDDIS